MREKFPELVLADSIKRCSASMGMPDGFHAVLLRQGRTHNHVYHRRRKCSNVDTVGFDAPQERLQLKSTKDEHFVAGMQWGEMAQGSGGCVEHWKGHESSFRPWSRFPLPEQGLLCDHVVMG